jgi:hypothetical protein
MNYLQKNGIGPYVHKLTILTLGRIQHLNRTHRLIHRSLSNISLWKHVLRSILRSYSTWVRTTYL